MINRPEDLEQRLRVVLQRQEAPPDFLAKVMQRAEPCKVVPISWWQRRSAVVAIAAGVLVAAVIPLGIVERQRHEQAISAHRQLVEALQITRAKLALTKQKIRRKHS